MSKKNIFLTLLIVISLGSCNSIPTSTATSTATLIVAPAPGLSDELDKQWTNCAREDYAEENCDSLYFSTNYRKYSDEMFYVYREFGATCGGRIDEMQYELGCSKQEEAQLKEPIPVLPWETSIKSICVEGTEHYTEVKPNHTPIMKSITSLLHQDDRFYLRIVQQDCDATLTFNITGEPLSAIYVPGGKLYTGVVVEGTITLSSPVYQTLTQPLDTRIEPPSRWNTQRGVPRSPEGAPILRANEQQLEDMIMNWFGVTVGFYDLGKVR